MRETFLAIITGYQQTVNEPVCVLSRATRHGRRRRPKLTAGAPCSFTTRVWPSSEVRGQGYGQWTFFLSVAGTVFLNQTSQQLGGSRREEESGVGEARGGRAGARGRGGGEGGSRGECEKGTKQSRYWLRNLSPADISIFVPLLFFFYFFPHLFC